jgi:hypothetical protein
LIFFGYGDYFFRLLHYAQLEDLTIVEIPARYMARRSGHSKSQFLRMSWSYTVEMFRLKFRAKRRSRPSERPGYGA